MSVASDPTNPMSESDALELLSQAIKRDSLYSAWTKMECLRFFMEETTEKYFEFAIREKHEGTCPGDPITQPIVDRFQVYRSTKKILWYDVVNDEYVAYKHVLEYRKR